MSNHSTISMILERAGYPPRSAEKGTRFRDAGCTVGYTDRSPA